MPYFPPAGGNVLLPNSVSDDYLADMPAGTLKGRVTGTGDPQNLTALQVLANLAIPFAQCRLYYISTTQIRLDRHDGCLLTIDNAPQIIPVAGVSLAPTGLTPSGLYNIYAYMSAGVMTLEASTTAWGVDSRNGIKIKGTDTTRTLVGKAQPQAGPIWKMDRLNVLVIGQYNRRPITFLGNISMSAASTAIISIGEQINLLSWGDTPIHVATSGYANISTAVTVNTYIFINESAYATVVDTQNTGWNTGIPISLHTLIAEGTWYMSPRGSVGTSAIGVTWSGNLQGYLVG